MTMMIASIRQSLARQSTAMNAGGSRTLFARQAAKSALVSNSSIVCAPQSHIAVGSFHTSAPRLEEFTARDGLVDILTREFDEDRENGLAVMPAELKELQTQLAKDWKIVDSDDTGMVRMIKNTPAAGNLKVQLSFHCQDTVEADAPEGEDEEDEEAEEPSLPISFTVLATKAGQSMVIQCMSEEGAAQIQSVAITNTETPEVITANGFISAQTYQGPEFTELAQDLQFSFQSFVEEDLGVNEDVASFIAMYCDYKEQSQYVNFLEQCKKIIS
mmetsp:Transcript_1235/g.1623  ORF Transcript_1235/g.1623 Transcript_1235/m.1623 type:complete len:273 (-) Transcript_1235:77-895(-)|eukprot:CAMPEP_0198136716 /NCGR_PEP_ID=MMETSP1443-20131203/337_1 /TAXON_ID=186043 /ORGANISM="Entomoneis sp., Strain CCMP2396" /LENGTH=272 /DNA_ID=CAMNT_0043797981 /DNA_START=53 /DNA_END=871 /DNA_ORIENTATION=-